MVRHVSLSKEHHRTKTRDDAGDGVPGQEDVSADTQRTLGDDSVSAATCLGVNLWDVPSSMMTKTM